MDRINQQILDGLRQIMGPGRLSFPATVKENYPDKDYVDVEDMAGTLYPEVRKRAAIDGKKGILITPVKDSTIVVSKLSGGDSNSFVIILFSEIESIKITIEDHILLLDKDGLSVDLSSGKLEIKNSQENLKTLVNDLLNEVMKITVTTGTGPSGTPINIPQLQQISQRIPKLFK